MGDSTSLSPTAPGSRYTERDRVTIHRQQAQIAVEGSGQKGMNRIKAGFGA